MRDFAESLVRPLNFGRTAPFWSWLAPLAAWIAYGLLHSRALDPTVAIFLAALLMPAVLAAVHQRFGVEW